MTAKEIPSVEISQASVAFAFRLHFRVSIYRRLILLNGVYAYLSFWEMVYLRPLVSHLRQ